MELLASDAQNPDFVGAHDPDRRLAVRFYERAVKDEFRSNKEGRPMFSTVDYVEIAIPGDKNSVIDVPVRPEHKERFPMHWARYQNSKGSGGQVVGTPIEQWPLLDRAQAAELKAMNFLTVDQVAEGSDQQLMKIGMIAGMGWHAFRDQAKRFLSVAKQTADLTARDDELQKLRDENEKLRKQTEEVSKSSADAVAELRAQMAQFMEQPRRGRPPKEQG